MGLKEEMALEDPSGWGKASLEEDPLFSPRATSADGGGNWPEVPDLTGPSSSCFGHSGDPS